MNNKDFETLTTCILALAEQPNAKEKIKLLLTNFFSTHQKEEYIDKLDGEIIGTVHIYFSEKELKQMPVKLARYFQENKSMLQLRQVRGVYEVRRHIKGKYVTGSSKDLKIAKHKFIKKAAEHLSKNIDEGRATSLFNEYLMIWLETTKKPYIKENTYKDYLHTIKLHILPTFQKRNIRTIKYMELQWFFNNLQESGRHRTAKKVYQILCNIFETAVADRLIPISPMLKIRLHPYEQNKGVSLTRDEEAFLVNDFIHNPNIYKQAFIFMLYTGIRRSELATLQCDGNWFTVKTAKQRKGMKEKIRYVPLSPMLEPHLKNIDLEKIKTISPHLLTNSSLLSKSFSYSSLLAIANIIPSISSFVNILLSPLSAWTFSTYPNPVFIGFLIMQSIFPMFHIPLMFCRTTFFLVLLIIFTASLTRTFSPFF